MENNKANRVADIWRKFFPGIRQQQAGQAAIVDNKARDDVDGVGYTRDSIESSVPDYGQDRGKHTYLRSQQNLPSSRRARYIDYDKLDSSWCPEAVFALDLYANDATQRDEHGHTIRISCSNLQVRQELEFLFFRLIDIDPKLWAWSRNLCKYGDLFLELVIDPENPYRGIVKVQELPAITMWRIETKRGKLVEFQQGYAPNYKAAEAQLSQQQKDNDDTLPIHSAYIPIVTQVGSGKTIRFNPAQIVHARIGEGKLGFKPYGVSILEPARVIAYDLRLMEDAMLVYRISRAPERKAFYIDIGLSPPHKGLSFVERVRDKLRKKKTYSEYGQSVNEGYNPLSIDEDYWLPTRPNSNTRIETLPGATNLGEIDDAVYFREKLYRALGIPKAYWVGRYTDISITRASLSEQDMQFARAVDRIQSSIAAGLMEVARRHLELIGVPVESFEDLQITLSPASDWRELARQDVIQGRINAASALGGWYSNFDILTRIFKLTPEEADEIINRKNKETIDQGRIQATVQALSALAQQPPSEEGGGEEGAAAEAGGGEEGTTGGETTPGGEEEATPPEQQTTSGEEEKTTPPAGGEEGELAQTTKPESAIKPPSKEAIMATGMEIEDFSSADDEAEEIDLSYLGV